MTAAKYNVTSKIRNIDEDDHLSKVIIQTKRASNKFIRSLGQHLGTEGKIQKD